MKLKIILTIFILILLTGCGMTGYVAKEIEDTGTIADKNLAQLAEAVNDKDPVKCNYIQVQDIREQCFMSLAVILDDKAICNSLLAPSPRDKCLEQFEQ